MTNSTVFRKKKPQQTSHSKLGVWERDTALSETPTLYDKAVKISRRSFL